MSDAKQSGEAPSPGVAEPSAEKSTFATLAVQLFVIPLAVVLFCVALAGLFMWLTAERKGLDDYLGALRASSGEQRTRQAQYLLNYIQDSKRWQGIFDVTAQISADREQFLAKNPHAVTDIVQVFEESKGQDPKTRRYLALVLGLLGDRQAIASLREGLDDGDAETVKNCLWALGRLDDEASARRIIELTHGDEQSVRLMAVYVLGSMDSPAARGVLEASLNVLRFGYQGRDEPTTVVCDHFSRAQRSHHLHQRQGATGREHPAVPGGGGDVGGEIGSVEGHPAAGKNEHRRSGFAGAQRGDSAT